MGDRVRDEEGVGKRRRNGQRKPHYLECRVASGLPFDVVIQKSEHRSHTH